MMMPFDTKTMLFLGFALGIVAFLIWNMFFKKAPTESLPPPPQEKQEEDVPQGPPPSVVM